MQPSHLSNGNLRIQITSNTPTLSRTIHGCPTCGPLAVVKLWVPTCLCLCYPCNTSRDQTCNVSCDFQFRKSWRATGWTPILSDCTLFNVTQKPDIEHLKNTHLWFCNTALKPVWANFQMASLYFPRLETTNGIVIFLYIISCIYCEVQLSQA